ncbi:SDR family oxidoreductase [Nevskia sp.]|uniref:SDR family NAD(P)-dependent oxidoreductase n=1 Tax=Nevskia sp. TaxID=1929292 RepID=UPI0025D9830B|nr:SDR family oxidoreductase [Nevskia sp.]
MKLGLESSTALVTASSGGIGLEIARTLAAEGATVIVNGRSDKAVAQAIASIRATNPDAKLIALAADNGTAEGCEATIKQLPEVDILVNNLGIYEAVGFFEESDADWQRLFEVNVMSGVRLARHYLRGMLARGDGRVVFISSESGVSPAPEMAHYSATKTMQLGISRALAELTKGTRVTVNSVLPGPTRTESVEKFMADLFPGLGADEIGKRFIAENRPTSLIGRLIDPSEIADVVAFVCSARAAIINGAAIRAEGGLVRSVF